MPNLIKPTAEQKAEFNQMADALAHQIIKALEGPQYPFVVMEALMRVHKFTVAQIDPETVGHVSMALAAYAGELLQQSAARTNPPAAGGSSAVH